MRPPHLNQPAGSACFSRALRRNPVCDMPKKEFDVLAEACISGVVPHYSPG